MNTTFYIGAGASANALPVINSIPEKIKLLLEKIKSLQNQFVDSVILEGTENTNERAAFKKFISELENLRDKSHEHHTIDTYAKKLWLNGNYNELDRLKISLSLYLSCEQILNGCDYRYDFFWASILNRDSNSLPKNLKIISWNYDLQFEISFDYFQGQNLSGGIDQPIRKLNVRSKHTKGENDVNKFSMYKINGSASYFQRSGFWNYTFGDPSRSLIDKRTVLKLISDLISQENRDVTCGLSYSWEEDFAEVKVIDKAVEGTVETDTLVIIGYSFPFFNRDADKKILTSMTNLKKVYIQSKEPKSIKERVMAIRPDLKSEDVIEIINLNEFYIPNDIVFEY
ncbi:hypothetical protein [Jiulongibacter sediminis]|uniref:hypothetical protein n=1 Tax=Jiulongibacter sediminis TaxID=1605367 RepID=UPI0026F03091|nr:hypothetical protein [Jiulongibacter sediminis]